MANETAAKTSARGGVTPWRLTTDQPGAVQPGAGARDDCRSGADRRGIDVSRKSGW